MRDGDLEETTDRNRTIPEFAVFERKDGWVAVNRRDPGLRVEHPEWLDLFTACMALRIHKTLEDAAMEFDRQRTRIMRPQGGACTPDGREYVPGSTAAPWSTPLPAEQD